MEYLFWIASSSSPTSICSWSCTTRGVLVRYFISLLKSWLKIPHITTLIKRTVLSFLSRNIIQIFFLNKFSWCCYTFWWPPRLWRRINCIICLTKRTLRWRCLKYVCVFKIFVHYLPNLYFYIKFRFKLFYISSKVYQELNLVKVNWDISNSKMNSTL